MTSDKHKAIRNALKGAEAALYALTDVINAHHPDIMKDSRWQKAEDKANRAIVRARQALDLR